MLSPPGLELRVRGLHAQNRPAERGGGRTARRAEYRRPAAVEGCRDARRLGAASRRACTDLPARRTAAAAGRRGAGAAGRCAGASPSGRGACDGAGRTAGHRRGSARAMSALARLTLDHPIGALAWDRLVLRDATATRTIGGGVVIDPFPPRRGRRTAERLAPAGGAGRAGCRDGAARIAGSAAPNGPTRATFFRSRNMPQAVRAAVMPARAGGRRGGTADGAGGAGGIADRCGGSSGGASRGGARPAGSAARAPAPGDAGAAIAGCLSRHHRIAGGRGSVEQDGPWLRLPTHRAVLSPQDERIWQRRAGADRRGALPPAAHARPGAGVVRAGAGDARHAEAAAAHGQADRGRAGSVLPERDGGGTCRPSPPRSRRPMPAGTLTAAAFRDRLANGRKVAIQILEFFDRAGVTVRIGDERRVRADRLGLFGYGGQANKLTGGDDKELRRDGVSGANRRRQPRCLKRFRPSGHLAADLFLACRTPSPVRRGSPAARPSRRNSPTCR